MPWIRYNLIPMHDRIIVRRFIENVAADGQIIQAPSNSKEKPQEGEVIAVGTGKILQDGKVIPCSLKVGEIVLFAKYGGTDYELTPGDEYLILREDEVMAKIEEEVVQDEQHAEAEAAKDKAPAADHPDGHPGAQ